MTTTSEDRTVGAPGALGERPAQWDHEHRPGRFGWIFAAVWLFYLLQPLSDAWTSRAPVPERVLAVVALLAFAVGFIVFFAQWRSRRTAGGVRRRGVVWIALGLGMLLLVLAAPGAGESTMGGFVYLGVTAAMTLPVQRALAVVAVLVALVVGLPRVVPGWTPQDDFIPSLVLACFAAYGISQIIERNAQLARAREQLVDLAVSRERERMSRDVHDILGHSLTVITVKTELAGRLLETAPPGPAVDRARTEVADAERLAREALADVRATVSGMRQLSLPGELAVARQALDAAGIAADLPSAVDAVPARDRELFAFALREGITNVVRHSGANRCVVRLGADCIEVRDDGRGPDGAVSGSGLAGLRERAEAAGARVETGAAPGGGFLLRVTRA